MSLKNQYTIPDLLTNESFLNYYFQKNEDDVLDWQEWVEEDAQNQALTQNAFLLLDKLSLKWDETEIKKRFSELKHSLSLDDLSDFEQQTPHQPLRLSYRRWWAATAAAILLIITSLSINFYLNKTDTANTIVENSSDNTSTTHTLGDGSTVILRGKSQLIVATDFNDKTRTVTLKGEAFFDVKPNADKPFLVLTDKIVTKVLGTSFTIKSPISKPNTEGGNSVEVEVVTGKVSVFKKSNTAQKNSPLENGVVLTPNQKVTYLTENEHFVVGIVPKPLITKEAEKQPDLAHFKFEETPLSDVVAKLERAYGIQIILSNDKINDCPITANLTQQPLFEKLDLICAILKADYEIQGAQILITGRGCD